MNTKDLENLFFEAIENSKTYRIEAKTDNLLLAIAYGLEHIAKELEMERMRNGKV